MLNSPQVSSIRYGTALDIDEQTEKMNKTKIIENITNQMSTNTNTHHVYNTYAFKPDDPPTVPGVDHSMDDGLDRQKVKQKMRLDHMRIGDNLKRIKMKRQLGYILKIV